MNFAPLYIVWRSAVNRARQQAADFRYLVAGLVIASYVVWLSVRPLASGAVSAGGGGDDGGGMAVAGGVLLFLVSAVAWWQGAGRLGVAPATRQWLLAAPLRDRDVLLFRIAGLQRRIALSALILVNVARSGSWFITVLHFVAIVVILNALECHRLVAALMRSRQQAGERGAAIVVWLARTFVVVACAALAWSAVAGASPLEGGFRAFVVLVRPAFSQHASEWARAMAVTVGVLVLHAAWLANARVAWAVRDAAVSRRAATTQFSLPAAATTPLARWLARYPATALLWKNLRTASRTQLLDRQFALVIGVPILLSLTSLKPFRPLTEFACGIAAMWAALLVLAGPLFVRCDLRLDLPKLRLLRTWPVTCGEICAAEIGASVIVLSGVQLCLLVLGMASLSFNPVVHIPPQLQVALVITIAVVLPGMNMAQVGAHVLVAMLFPKWGPLGVVSRERSSGVGYFYLGVVGSLVSFVTLGVLPAAAGAMAGFSVLPLAGGPVASVVAGLTASGVAGAEGVLLMRAAAQTLGRLEFSSLPA